MDLSRIFSITVNRSSPRITRQALDLPLIYGYVPTTVIPVSELTREYLSATALADMVTDGFLTTDPVYQCAVALLSQSPRPSKFKVGCSRLTWDHDVDLLAKTFATGETIELSITKNGVTRDYTRACGGASLAAEAAALKVLLDADAAGWFIAGTAEFTATVNGDNLEIRATVGDEREMLYWDGFLNLNISDVTTDRGIAAEVANILAYDPAWYCLIPADSFGAAELTLLATAIEATGNKIMSYATQDTVCEAGTGILHTLHAASRDRSIGYYSQNGMDEYPGATNAGRFLGEGDAYVGEVAWANKSFSGVTPSVLTSAALTLIEADSGNHYTTTAGVGNCFPGTVASGEYVDIIHLADYVVARIAEGCFSLSRATRKIPYTDAGVAQVRAVVLGALQDKVPGGFVEGSLTFTAPAVSTVDPADKAARTLPGVSFGATFSGAILYVDMTADLEF